MVCNCLLKVNILLIRHLAVSQLIFPLLYSMVCRVGEPQKSWPVVSKDCPLPGLLRHWTSTNCAATCWAIPPPPSPLQPPSGFSRRGVFPSLLESGFSLHLRLSHDLTHYSRLCTDGNTSTVWWFYRLAIIQQGVKCQHLLHFCGSPTWAGWSRRAALPSCLIRRGGGTLPWTLHNEENIWSSLPSETHHVLFLLNLGLLAERLGHSTNTWVFTKSCF